MKVVCDNCRAVYKIPDAKLVKPVNKATCRSCGHRMLIPRPRKDADPEERTLVTAVPPTPPPAPMRGASAPARPIEREPEETLPGNAGPGWTPPPRSRTEQPTYGSTPVADSGPGLQVRTSRTPEPALFRDTPTHKQRIREPEPPIAMPLYDESAVPTQVKPNPSVEPPPPRSAPPKREAASGRAAKSASGHDPRGDMSLALLGGLSALAGAVVLGAVGLLGPPDPLVLIGVFLGLLITTSGAFVAIFVMLTGSRGRKPAKRFISLFVGTAFAFFLAIVPPVGRIAYDVITGQANYANQLASLVGASRPEGPAVAPGTPPAIPADPTTNDATASMAATDGSGDTTAIMAQPDAGGDGTTDAVEAPADPPKGTTSRRGTSRTDTSRSGTSRSDTSRTDTSRTDTSRTDTSRTGTSRSGTTSRTPKPPPKEEPDELDLPDDALTDGGSDAGSNSDLPKTPPMTAVDVMVKSNVSVKKCFFYYQKDHGSLPPEVTVKFRINQDGSATGVGVTQSKYAGTELDSCLSKAIKGITFPPSQDGLDVTGFPFVFE